MFAVGYYVVKLGNSREEKETTNRRNGYFDKTISVPFRRLPVRVN